MHPVFVGGTGRSGTTVVGRLIAAHPRFAGVPFEIRVHVLSGYVARGKRSMEWLRAQALDRQEEQLHHIVDRKEFIEFLGRFEAGIETGTGTEAAREFINALMMPVAEAQAKPSWVEMTPLNAVWGAWLNDVFPDMRLVHMVRDGRDVATSVAATWGRRDVFDALAWWGKRTTQIAANMDRMSDGSVLTVEFERLARDDREATLARLLKFLGIEEHPGIREFFAQELNPERANIGRWKRNLGRTDRSSLQVQYEKILSSLRERGIEWVPDPQCGL